MSEPTVETWDGCYEANWHGIHAESAFAHPAKAARRLMDRIFDELFLLGALQRGDLVVDPFGGVGSTGLAGAPRWLRVVCVELEPKFVEAGRLSFARHRPDWRAMGYPLPVLVQGDSRALRQVLRAADAIVSSPPYARAKAHPSLGHPELDPSSGGDILLDRCTTGTQAGDERYGETPGQLGDMAEGSVDAVVSSPPYAEIASGAGGLNHLPPRQEGQQSGRSATSASQDTDQRYGASAGQLARMGLGDVDAVVSSPPFPQPYTGGGGINEKGYGDGSDKVGERTYQGRGGDRADGNLETLELLGAVDGVVGSPPYQDNEGGVVRSSDWSDPCQFLEAKRGKGVSDAGRLTDLERNEARTVSQAGADTGETFWSASKQILEECFAILKPGGVAVFITKDFIRDKRRVPFSDDWQRLCEHVGFVTVKRVRASLVTETQHGHLFGGPEVTRRKRASFFRRLYESKYPENAIDWESVDFFLKP